MLVNGFSIAYLRKAVIASYRSTRNEYDHYMLHVITHKYLLHQQLCCVRFFRFCYCFSCLLIVFGVYFIL